MTEHEQSLNRIIVVGASAGGVGALCSLVEALPSNLPAAILIVLHIGHTSVLAEVLRRCHSQGPIVSPQDGETLKAGGIYVAVPDHHMVVAEGRIRLRKSPRENLHRPSVDVLFRSAARNYGSKVIGVILTGSMDDGASGIFAIKAKGGIAVVQDPKDAMIAEMPLSALDAAEVDYCLPLAEIAPVLIRLAHEPVNEPDVANDQNILHEKVSLPDDNHPAFVCPECDGPLVEYRDGKLMRFSCKIGHKFSLEGLTEAHAESLERGLWIAMRVLDDRAAIQRLRAQNFSDNGQEERAAPALEIALQAEQDAAVLRSIMERI